MARTPNRTLLPTLAAALLATAPVAAAGPPPAPGPNVSPAQKMWTYTLQYQPRPADDPARLPAPVTLLIAPHYAIAIELFGEATGTELKLVTTYPSFGRPKLPEACEGSRCEDPVLVTLRLAPDVPRQAHAGSVQSEVETLLRDGGDVTTLQAVPAPPGYEEAFTRAWPGSEPGQAFEKYLIYRDERGSQQSGHCSLESGSRPSRCEFSWLDPRSHLLVSYDFPMPLLSQRQAIEDGVRALIDGWQAEAAKPALAPR